MAKNQKYLQVKDWTMIQFFYLLVIWPYVNREKEEFIIQSHNDKRVKKPFAVSPQQLVFPERKGYVVIEWVAPKLSDIKFPKLAKVYG